MVIVHIRLSSEVLPVMSINTPFFIMIFAPWAPYRLKVEHVEVSIFRFYKVQQINCDFILRVSKGTHLSIFTIVHVIWISLAEFTFILLWMIKLLDSIMCLQAIFSTSVNTLIMILRICYFRAHFTGVRPQSSSSIFFDIMIEKASLWVMTWNILIVMI